MTPEQLDAAVDAGARGWFDTRQTQRRDDARLDPKTGQPWQWDDVNEADQRAYRAFVRPIVVAALESAHTAWCCTSCGHSEPHDLELRGPRPDGGRFMCRVLGCGCAATAPAQGGV